MKPGNLFKRISDKISEKRETREAGRQSADPGKTLKGAVDLKKNGVQGVQIGKIQNPENIKNTGTVLKEDFRDVFARIVSPEERTLKNLLNIKFWREKQKNFTDIRKKQKQDISVYETLAMGAAPTREYYVLTVLSCIIATMGLIQGSAAVIIGAMIVAPLMTPILAFSLGVVWGDLFLIKLSAASISKGVIAAVFISAIIAFMVPIPAFSDEILARTSPSLFDVAVAMASGLIGAYGNANKRISNSLVGIAIAVALMPPLCTIGISLGKFEFMAAGGAALLFLINLVSISLAGAIVFWIMKIHPVTANQEEVTKRAISQIAVSFIILAAISIPVGFFMAEAYHRETALKNARETLAREFKGLVVFSSSVSGRWKDTVMDITLTGAEKPDLYKMTQTVNDLKNRYSGIKDIKIRFFLSESCADGTAAEK